MQNVNFRIFKFIEVGAPIQEEWTKDRILAFKELTNGHKVQAFAGRQQRRVSLTKAFLSCEF